MEINKLNPSSVVNSNFVAPNPLTVLHPNEKWFLVSGCSDKNGINYCKKCGINTNIKDPVCFFEYYKEDPVIVAYCWPCIGKL